MGSPSACHLLKPPAIRSLVADSCLPKDAKNSQSSVSLPNNTPPLPNLTAKKSLEPPRLISAAGWTTLRTSAYVFCPCRGVVLLLNSKLQNSSSMLVPPWLDSLLSTAFFSVCRTHSDATRSESNMFCLDCAGDAFCYYCRSARHKDHQVIQIRRSSYHDVVRVAEIQKVLDIGGVQTYVINSARVLFLNERPQPRTGKGVAHSCEICGRSLLDPFRFCSLGCKLLGIKRNGDASFILDGKVEIRGEGISGREEEELREGVQHDIYPPTPPPPSNPKRRKGIPQRAPFGS